MAHVATKRGAPGAYRFGAAVPRPVHVGLGALGRCNHLRQPVATFWHRHVAASDVPVERTTHEKFEGHAHKE